MYSDSVSWYYYVSFFGVLWCDNKKGETQQYRVLYYLLSNVALSFLSRIIII